VPAQARCRQQTKVRAPDVTSDVKRHVTVPQAELLTVQIGRKLDTVSWLLIVVAGSWMQVLSFVDTVVIIIIIIIKKYYKAPFTHSGSAARRIQCR